MLTSVRKTKCVVTAEEHQLNGGLGDSIAQLYRVNCFTARMVGVNDSFGESGTPDELMVKYGLDAKNIVAAVQKVMARRA